MLIDQPRGRGRANIPLGRRESPSDGGSSFLICTHVRIGYLPPALIARFGQVLSLRPIRSAYLSDASAAVRAVLDGGEFGMLPWSARPRELIHALVR